MTTILSIIAALAAIGALVALILGIIAFLRQQDAAVRNPGAGPSASSLRQNRMMWRRIQFQAIAVIAAVLVMVLARSHG